ncbi:MAG: hypothetical protein L0215_22665 [Gemmataceae bacterium]|nr:hypothetical protein [Gemmataceae bacterium]
MSGAWVHCACFRFSPRIRQIGYLMAALLLALSANLFAQERRPAPHFQGKELPEPPAQTQPWQPPQTTLPKDFVSATEALFGAGLADPRGCDYRVIKVAVGNCWDGGGSVVTTHGWVLPDAVAGQRFAVCWNGLVYPALSVGDKADWDKDVESMFQSEKNWKKRAARSRVRNGASTAKRPKRRCFRTMTCCRSKRVCSFDWARKNRPARSPRPGMVRTWNP